MQKPLWCGETGHPLHLAETYHAVARFIAMLETEKIGWALWPLKDCGAMAMVHADKNGAWNQLCAKLSDNWVFWDIFTKDSILSSEKETDRYKYYEWLAEESTKGWGVVCKHLKTVPFETFFNALDDFIFENCIKNNKLVPTAEWLA